MALQLASTGAYSAFNGYWSSSSGPDLGPYCDSGIQSVTLDLVRVLRAGPSTFTLSSDCWSEGILSNVSSSGQLVDRCLSLKDDIAYCQYKNIQVLVSVTVDDDQLDDAAGKDLAHLVYNSFGTYNNDWNGTRLFGQDVAVNGFNFNISPDFNSRTVLEMINQLRDLDDMLLIAGTSSCPLDSGNAKNHDTVKQLDALFLHYPQSSTCVGTDSATLDNFLAPQNWIQLLTGDKNTGAKLFISLPVSPWAAEADTSLTAKYASDIICKVKDDANFGGVSLWDDGKATSNENGDSVFYQQVLATRNQACSSETKSLDGESIKAESPSAHSLTSAKLVQRKVQQGPPVSNRWNLVEGSTPENQIWEAPPAIVRSCPPGGAICSQQRRVEYRSVTYYIPCRRDQKNARPRRETVTLAQRQSLEEELNQRIEQSLDTARNEYLRLFGERRQQQIAVWKNTLQREAFPAEIEEQNSLMKKADDIEMYRLMENYRRELDLWKARTLEEVARQEQELKNKRPAKRPNSQPVREAAQATSSSWLAQKTASTPLQAKKDFKMNKSSSRKPKVAATLKPESAVGRQQVATKTNTAKKVGAKTVISTNKARPASTKRPEAAKKVHKSYTKPEESRPKAQEASRVKPRPSRSTNLGIPIKKAKMDEVKNPEASTKNAKPSTWKKPDGPISNPRQSTLNKAETSSLSASTKSKASGQGPKPSSSRKAETSSIKPESRQSTEAATATKTQSSRQVTPSLSAFATKVSASRSTVSSKQDKVSTLKAQEPTLKAVSPSPSVSAEQIAVAKMDKVAMLKAFPSSRTSSCGGGGYFVDDEALDDKHA
ncbi:hypothetical protein CDD81_5112 [Ophiocordyceps australis]|uniref:Chitinase n=1 Tax=Ophiocordyceps australis TaxID=1399860 RepID=A0A2C5Y5N2_9HYPO|nr:hypothetical protein CDD81_5112 [Ophiocordyceps australis]